MPLPRITHVTNLRSIQLSTEQLSYGKNYTLKLKTDLHYNSLRKKSRLGTVMSMLNLLKVFRQFLALLMFRSRYLTKFRHC